MRTITLTPKQRVIGWTALDIIATYIVPFLSLAYHFELFGGIHVEPTTKGLAWAYIFGFILVVGIMWRVRLLIKLSNKKGWQFALAKFGSPLFFFLAYYMLGLADGNIDKLRAFSLLSGISMTIAIYFRYKAGKALESTITIPTQTSV